MKRHYHSTKEKPTPVIHTTIRLTNSMRTISEKPVERDKNLSSVSVARHIHHRGRKTKKTSVTSFIDKDLKNNASSIISVKSNQSNRRLSQSQQNIRKTDNPIEDSLQQTVNFSNLIEEKTKNDKKSNQDNNLTSEKISFNSIKMDQKQSDTRNSKIGEINNHNNLKVMNMYSDRTSHANEYHRNAKLKHDKKYFANYCCSCSRVCAVVSLFAGILFGIVLASIVIALSTKTEPTTTRTTIAVTETMITTINTSTISPTTTVSTSIISSTTTISTSITSTITISTSVITTVPILSIGSNDTLQGLWNTTAGGDSIVATPGTGVGNYVANESPRQAFDNSCSNKFTSFGHCTSSPSTNSATCGLNTGFYATLLQGAAVMKSLRFCTGNDSPPRDPITMTLEGSTQNGSALLLGSSWSLIYNGSCGLDVDPGRNSLGQTQSFSYNSIPYASYRILITSKRGVEHAVQYGELALFGY